MDFKADPSSHECQAENLAKYRQHKAQAQRLRKAAIGKNRFTSGFSALNRRAHWNRHRNQYSSMSEQEYAREALRLIQLPCGGDIRGYARENGQIIRYSRLTGNYVVGYNDEDKTIPHGIATMYKLDERVY